MKIVFLGEDSFSAVVLTSLIEAGHQLMCTITPYYENLKFKRLEAICLKNGIPFFRDEDVNSLSVQLRIKKMVPELIVSAHFEKLLKKEIIEIPKFGCINLHPSLLPYYRGMAPQHWPIINAEKETGVTVHFINEEIDKGEIILQERIKIDPSWYVADLQKKFLEIYPKIVVKAIEVIKRGGPYTAQSHIVTPYYGRLKKKDCKIDILRGVEKALSLIKGVSKPYFGATIENYKIWKAHSATYGEMNDLMIICNTGTYLDSSPPFIKFCDGVLIIDKFEKIT